MTIQIILHCCMIMIRLNYVCIMYIYHYRNSDCIHNKTSYFFYTKSFFGTDNLLRPVLSMEKMLIHLRVKRHF